MKHSKRLSCLFFTVLLCAICLTYGCQSSKHQEAAGENGITSQQLLQLQVTAISGDGTGTELSDAEIHQYFNAGVHYTGVSDVQIFLNDNFSSLEDAIRQGKINADTLSYWGATDAKNGFCIRKQESYNGLDNVTFYYSDYNVRLVNDVLETPTGEEYPVTFLAVFDHLGSGEFCADLFDPETGISVSQENWGIAFTAQVTDGNLAVSYTQHGGTALGSLRLDHATLRDAKGYVYGGVEEKGYLLDFGDEIRILPQQSGNFTCQLVGDIPVGEYILYLTVRDNYDTQNIHPLLSAHKPTQSYCVPITVD